MLTSYRSSISTQDAVIASERRLGHATENQSISAVCRVQPRISRCCIKLNISYGDLKVYFSLQIYGDETVLYGAIASNSKVYIKAYTFIDRWTHILYKKWTRIDTEIPAHRVLLLNETILMNNLESLEILILLPFLEIIYFHRHYTGMWSTEVY